MTDPQTAIVADAGAPNLAIDLQPDVTGRGDFVLDVSELDGPDLLGYDPGTGAWLNVVCDVTRVSLRRGATRLQGVLTRAEAGTCTVEARDVHRRLDPTVNADAIHPGIPFRLRAWDVDEAGTPWEAVLFTGVLDDIAVTYDKEEPPVVTLEVHDLIARLEAWKSSGYDDPGIGAGDNLLDRVTRILAEAGSDLVGRIADPDSSYVATLASSNLDAAWSDITAAQDAELGRVWVNNADDLVVRGRWSELSGPVRGTLSDIHDEIVAGVVHCCYTDPSVVYGTEQLTNRAIASRRVPSTGGTPSVPAAVAQVDDEYSAARYGLRAMPQRTLELQTDEQLAPWGEALITTTTEPRLRVDAVSPAPWTAPEAWPVVCATDIGDRWIFRLRPSLGPTVARTVGVLGIEHDITPEQWEIRWHTDDAPTPGVNNPSGWFALDVSALDEGDLLAPFGGKPV